VLLGSSCCLALSRGDMIVMGGDGEVVMVCGVEQVEQVTCD
jgi:acetyl-CoA acetyltransferase